MKRHGTGRNATWPPGPFAMPKLARRAEDVPQFKRDVMDWMSSGACRWQLALCFELDAQSDALDWCEAAAPHLNDATNLFVTDNMVELLHDIAPRYPLDGNPPDPSFEHGFLVLQRPIQLWPNADDLLAGIYWHRGTCVALLSYPPNPYLLVTVTPTIDLGSPVEDRVGWSTPVQEAWKVLVACLTLLDQRIGVHHDATYTRADRRRLRRLQPGPLPGVQIIELRRPTQHESAGGPPSSVEWTRRWIVDSHWRNQYHPSTGKHHPILISPHIKGPAHLPLIVQDRVYRLSR